MLNRNILENSIYNKLSNQLFNFVVFESFYRAIPLDKGDLDIYMSDLKEYSDTVLESVSSFKTYRDSMKSSKSYMLNSICDDIDEVAFEATKRVMKDIPKDVKEDLKDVVDKSEFSTAELKKFRTKNANLTVKEVGNIISDKVVKALKTEKDDYEESEMIKEKISTALKPKEKANTDAGSPDFDMDTDESTDNNPEMLDEENKGKGNADTGVGETDPNLADTSNKDGGPKSMAKESLESWMDINLDINLPRTYISFFSKLQDQCMESLTHSTEAIFRELNPDVLSKITLENVLKIDTNKDIIKSIKGYIKDLSVSYESFVATEGFVEPMEIATKGMISAIIIYTLLETLKTLRVYSIDKDQIRAFMNKPTMLGPGNDSTAVALERKLDSIINTGNKRIASEIDIDALENYKNNITDIHRMITELPDDYKPLKDKFNKAYEAIINTIETKKDDLNIFKDKKISTESYYADMDMRQDVVAFNRIFNNYGKHPNISEFRLIFNPANEGTGIVDIEMYNKGNKINKEFVIIKGKHDNTKNFEHSIMEALENSKLIHEIHDKSINMYYTDSCKLKNIV